MDKTNTQQQKLVSIIMPAYNSEEFIEDSIESVIKQTYLNWELIIVDDCSTDKTQEIIEKWTKRNEKILYFKLIKNSGAAVARNTAIEKATGQYLAFLDSDDLWEPTKLEKQIGFMESNKYSFSCTSYDHVNSEGISDHKIMKAQAVYKYKDILKNCPGNSTIVYNAEKLGKFYIPDIRKRNDFVMWLQVIKKAEVLYGIPDVLTHYRVREGSLSKNKTNLLQYQWKVYREIEELSLVYSLYLMLYKVVTTLKK